MEHRVYEALVRLALPARVRARLGPDLIQCHRQVMARASGPLGRTAAWVREVADLVVAAWRIRRSPGTRTGRPGSGGPRGGPGLRGSTRISRAGALADDLVHAARALVRSPGTTAFVILVMGGGLGAATAVYSAVRHTLLHPLPYAAADRIVSLWRTVGGSGSLVPPTPEQAEAWSAQPDLVEGTLAISGMTRTLTGMGDPEAVDVVHVSGDYFRTLGVQPALGRSFAPEELVDGSRRAVILGYGTWRRRFGGDPGALGVAVTLDGEPWTVVGVAPRNAPPPTGFQNEPAFYLPATPSTRIHNHLAILRPGVDVDTFRERIDTLVARANAEAGGTSAFGGTARSGSEIASGRLRRSLTILSVAVGLLLLVACLNVSALLVNRADRRRHETAVRVALGVGRGRLVRQHIVESLLLAGTAGVVGLAVATGGLELLDRLRPDDLAALDRVRLDGNVLGFAATVALVTGLAFGALPALQARSAGALTALRAGQRGPREDTGSRRARWILVVGEVALSFTLVTASVLLVRNMMSIQRVDVGFDPAGLVVVDVEVPEWKYEEGPDRADFHRRVLRAIEASGPVASATGAQGIPTRPGAYFGTLEIEGRALPDEEANGVFFGFGVGDDYFEVMGQRILEGRAFSRTEVEDEAPVYVVGQSTARALWPEGDAVGRRMRIGDGDWHTVVGVVADVPVFSADMTGGRDRQLYLPRGGAEVIAARIRGDARAAIPAIRRAVRAVAPEAPVELRDAETMLGTSVATQRFVMRLLMALGGLALLLAAIGLYGVVAQTVGRRTREIGIRISLGARSGGIVWMILRSGGLAVGVGLVLGAGLAVAGGRVIESQLALVEPRDLASFLAAATVLASVAGLASWIPARRAARIDPVRAITAE